MLNTVLQTHGCHFPPSSVSSVFFYLKFYSIMSICRFSKFNKCLHNSSCLVVITRDDRGTRQFLWHSWTPEEGQNITNYSLHSQFPGQEPWRAQRMSGALMTLSKSSVIYSKAMHQHTNQATCSLLRHQVWYFLSQVTTISSWGSYNLTSEQS